MSRKLHIAESLALPLDWMTLASVIYGARGSGKTTLGAVMAEEVHKAGQRFCVIDLKGDWWGLKSSADGRSAAIPTIVFGGDHADVPLEDGAGAFVADTVAELSQSCVLDFENISKGKQVRFLAAFFERLYHVNREPLLLFLDEAQRYAPQKTFDPDSAKCLGAVEDLVKLGRKHGIGVVVITQRGAGLNKEISELGDMLIACRTPGPIDQERVRGWLEANVTKYERDIAMASLAGLLTGTAIFASGHPDLKLFGTHAVRRRETFDSSATPRVGQRRVEPKLLAKPDLEVLRVKMSAAIERAKENDPAALRTKIAELMRGLHQKAAPPVEVRVEVPVLTDEALHELRGAMTSLRVVSESIARSSEMISEAVERATREVVQTRIAGVPRLRDFVPTPAPRRTLTEQIVENAAVGNLKRGARDILVAVAASRDGRTRAQVATIAGISPKGSTLGAYLSNLRHAGYIEETGDRIEVSSAGLAEAKRIDPQLHVRTPDELREMWLPKFKRGARLMLEELLDKYPKWIDRVALAEKLGIETAGSTLGAYVSNLVAAGVAEKSGASLRASPTFFGDAA